MDQQPQPTSPDQVVPQQAKFSAKSFITLILVAIIAAFLGALGMYFVMSPKVDSQQFESLPQTSSRQIPSPSPTAATTTNSWPTFRNIESQYTIEYPSDWVATNIDDPSGLGYGLGEMSSYTGFTVKNDKPRPGLVWLKVWKNPENLNPVEFWTQKDAFWEHVGGGTQQQRIQEAQQYYDKMERVSVGKKEVEGYKVTVGDTLARTEIYWFLNDKVYNLGFSPEDQSHGYTSVQKEEITNHMLSTFKVAN